MHQREQPPLDSVRGEPLARNQERAKLRQPRANPRVVHGQHRRDYRGRRRCRPLLSSLFAPAALGFHRHPLIDRKAAVLLERVQFLVGLRPEVSINVVRHHTPRDERYDSVWLQRIMR